jgi:hypothetical protein
MDILEAGVGVLQRLIMFDKGHVHLTRYVNKHIIQHWSDEQAGQVFEKPLHSSEVTIWRGVSAFGIIGPYFSEEEHCTVTINTGQY